MNLDGYFDLLKEVHQYFEYQEQWRVFPLDDQRGSVWKLQQEPDGSGSVKWADSEEELQTCEGNCYSGEIYTQRHHDHWVWRAELHTMVLVATHCDGNILLMIFDNALERPNLECDW